MSLDKLIDKKLKLINNSKDAIHELQTKIHPDLNFTRNSINLLVGKPGSGKTYHVLRELMKLSIYNQSDQCEENEELFHLIVYVTDNCLDKTYNKMKKEINIPTEIIPYNQAEQYLTNLMDYKAAYSQVIEYDLENHPQVIHSSLDEIKSVLHVNDFSRKHLQTIILYDDALGMLKKKGR
jgi:hypothetical protein